MAVAHWKPMLVASVPMAAWANRKTPVRTAEEAIIQRPPKRVSTQKPAATGPRASAHSGHDAVYHVRFVEEAQGRVALIGPEMGCDDGEKGWVDSTSGQPDEDRERSVLGHLAGREERLAAVVAVVSKALHEHLDKGQLPGRRCSLDVSYSVADPSTAAYRWPGAYPLRVSRTCHCSGQCSLTASTASASRPL